MRALAPLACAALIAAGCGAATKGAAAVWVTRDRGARVLVVAKVPAGLTAMQALERVAKVRTRYGGRFVESIDGLAGSASRQRDWFYFVNGYEADRGAAEYRLHPGDVEWWDYRSWAGTGASVPVVVGAFPEPFLHGYAGKRRPVVVLGPDPAAGRAVARAVRGRYDRTRTRLAQDVNTLIVEPGAARFTGFTKTAGSPVRFVFHGDWHALLAGKYRYRYSVP